ncbi:MAG TPA: diaminobutyrate acetyltransferase [Magnetovibrio sp.]
MTEINMTNGVKNVTRPRTESALYAEPKISSMALKDSETVMDADGVAVRSVMEDEGALLWQLARDSKGVDLNSPYAYMMTCRNFASTSVVAEVFGMPAGFVIGHRVPGRANTLFVWQVAVLPEFRGLGIGRRLLEGLIERPGCAGVRKLEATVTPSNSASKALFDGFARSLGAMLKIQPGFGADDFPKDKQCEAENLFTIEPIRAIA